MIRLVKVNESNYKDCLKLKVFDNQTKFVSNVAVSLANAYVYYEIVKPYAIYDNDQMIGFILLRYNEEYRNYFIWQFLIDEKHQSKGYGTQALNVAIDLMKSDSRCSEIVTTYKLGNERIKKIYEKLGFIQLGEIQDDEVDMVLRF
ncbi:GNAT family N-acetyltransferase [Mycoplasmatota bacterium WC44]